MAKFISCKTPGVSYKEHETRKHGRQKDRYYVIRYQRDKKQVQENLGWASAGWSEQTASELLAEIKSNIRKGEGPQSLKEKRELLEKEKQEEKQQELETESERITLQEVWERYLPIHKSTTTEKTWMNTERYYKNWIQKELGDKKLKDITVDEIQKIVMKAVKTKASRTADFVKTVFRQIFNFAKLRELYFKDNPAMKIKVKRDDNKRQRYLTKEEAKILLDALNKHSPDVHDMALIAIYEGMRAGEIFNLKWEHIIWNSERIAIVDPKNGENRMQPLHPLVKEMLQKRATIDSNGYIFKARDGGKIEDMSDTFQRTVEELGFNKGITDPRQKLVFHSLRHTYASWLVMNNVDLYTTQKLMGHKSNQMTQRYAHLAPGHLDKAVQTLESI